MTKEQEAAFDIEMYSNFYCRMSDEDFDKEEQDRIRYENLCEDRLLEQKVL